MKTEPEKPDLLKDQLKYLKLGYLLRHHGELTAEAAKARCSHAEFLRRLVQAETQDRQIRALDRLLHRAQTVVIEGKSYRMKDRLADEPAS